MKTIIKVGIGAFFLGVLISQLYQFTDTESSETLIMPTLIIVFIINIPPQI